MFWKIGLAFLVIVLIAIFAPSPVNTVAIGVLIVSLVLAVISIPVSLILSLVFGINVMALFAKRRVDEIQRQSTLWTPK
jgi:ABC-type dipeptide/oligopeptide/nickel transport system permease component